MVSCISRGKVDKRIQVGHFMKDQDIIKSICNLGPTCPYFNDLCCKICPQRHWCYGACERCLKKIKGIPFTSSY